MVEGELNKSHGAASTIKKEFPFTLLPRGLNSQFLKYPALKNMWLSNDDAMHLLCNLSGEIIHIIYVNIRLK